MDFCKEMEETGVKTLICTDISRDGAMRGTNREMYRELKGLFIEGVLSAYRQAAGEDFEEG